jgi:cellobiose phosphorylase
LNKVFTSLLGWRESFGTIVLDPVLPASLDGLTVQFRRTDKTVTAQYRVSRSSHTPKAITINDRAFSAFTPLSGPYRTAGVAIPIADFDAALDRTENRIQIEL